MMADGLIRRNGHVREPSRLLKYLPGIYADDMFLSGFLQIFDSFWLPLERQIGELYRYFDPTTAPDEFLSWLSGWVDLVLDDNWEVERKRELIRCAADLYRWRGTALGLRNYLRIYLGYEPQILEDGGDADPFLFTVVLQASDPPHVQEALVRRIIDEEKPAHTTYRIRRVDATENKDG